MNKSSEFNWQVGEMRAIRREMKFFCTLHACSPASVIRGNMKSVKFDPTQQQNQKKSVINQQYMYKKIISPELNQSTGTGTDFACVAFRTCLLHHKKVARVAVARRAQLLGVHFLLPLNKNLSKIAGNSETNLNKK